MAACAPKTYQRILRRRRTLARSESSSTLAGRCGTVHSLGELQVVPEIGGALRGGGPIGMEEEGVPAQFVGEAHAIGRAQCPPVRLLRGAHGGPVAREGT